MLLTVFIETSLFALYGYRQRRFLAVIAAANVLTNVTLNLCIFLTALLFAGYSWGNLPVYLVIAAGEAGAIAAEYMIYAKFLEQRSRVLLGQTIASNAAAFFAGVLIDFFTG